jgi:hypothetical protein
MMVMLRKEDSPRRAGRPSGSFKLIAANPQRYLFAMTELAVRNAVGRRQTQGICTTFASLKECRPLRIGEFVIGHEPVTVHFRERWRRCEPFLVVHKSWDSMSADDRAAAIVADKAQGRCYTGDAFADWKAQKRIRALADNLRRTLDLWRSAPPSNPNRHWIEHMGAVMKICFEGLDDLMIRAEACAIEIDEYRYFDRYLRPILLEHANFLRVGKEIPFMHLDRVLDLIDPNFASE